MDSLSSRTISGFPISISTALAFESLFDPRLPVYDPDRKIPQRVDLTQYSEIWISLSTLFRNLVNSMTKEMFMHTNETEISDALLTEMEVINSLFANEGNNLCKPIYFYNKYDSVLAKNKRHVKFREDKTDGQKFYTYKHVKSIERILKMSDEIFEFDGEIKPTHKSNAMMLSHIPYDLVSFKNFHRLDLLESNTGKLKPRNQWNSKYYPVGDADMSILPFMRKFLFVFGDRVLIQPMDLKLRRLVLDIAEKRRWTSMTTKDKIILDLELEIKEPFVLQVLKSL